MVAMGCDVRGWACGPGGGTSHRATHGGHLPTHPVCLMTASRMVTGTASPPTVTGAGSFTPGLLLFSAPGSGASRVPFPGGGYGQGRGRG